MTYSVTSCLFLARACDDKLERVAVTARDEDSTTALLFFGGSGGKKIIRLETRRFRILKAASSNKLRQPLKLLKQGVVELASALVCGKFLMPVGGYF